MLLWYFSCQTVLFMPILKIKLKHFQIHFEGKRKDIPHLMRKKTQCGNLAVKLKKNPGW